MCARAASTSHPRASAVDARLCEVAATISGSGEVRTRRGEVPERRHSCGGHNHAAQEAKRITTGSCERRNVRKVTAAKAEFA
jgi:hypothetical protein